MAEQLTPQQAELVRSHLWLVDVVVTAMRGSWPRHVDRAELVSAGRMGLVEAASRFDPERGDFTGFARMRIRGALIDALRANDWAPRRVRAEGRAIHTAIESAVAEAGRLLDLTEQAQAAGMSVERLLQHRSETHSAVVLSLDAPIDPDDSAPSLAEALLEPSEQVEQRLEDIERRAFLADAIAALPERLRAVVVGSFLEERSQLELAEEFAVTPSRISQLRAEALAYLELALRRHWEHHSAREGDLDTRRARTYLESVGRYVAWRRSVQTSGPVGEASERARTA